MYSTLKNKEETGRPGAVLTFQHSKATKEWGSFFQENTPNILIILLTSNRFHDCFLFGDFRLEADYPANIPKKSGERIELRAGFRLPSCQRGNEAIDTIAVFDIHRQSRSSRLVSKDFMSLRASQTMCM